VNIFGRADGNGNVAQHMRQNSYQTDSESIFLSMHVELCGKINFIAYFSAPADTRRKKEARAYYL